MDFGIGAVTVHDEIPNKSCSVILRELYNIIHASFEWTATSNTIPKIRRDAIALQAEMDRPLCAFFFLFQMFGCSFFFIHLFFFFSFTFLFSDYTANALAAASDGSEHQSHPSALSSISVSTTVALCSATSGTSCFAVLLADPLLGR